MFITTILYTWPDDENGRFIYVYIIYYSIYTFSGLLYENRRVRHHRVCEFVYVDTYIDYTYIHIYIACSNNYNRQNLRDILILYIKCRLVTAHTHTHTHIHIPPLLLLSVSSAVDGMAAAASSVRPIKLVTCGWRSIFSKSA